MAGQHKNIADVHAAAYRAYVKAMQEGMAELDVDALDIPSGGTANAMALPSCHCVGTLYCMGHFGCAGGCVMCAGTVGTIMCYANAAGEPPTKSE